MTAPAQRPRDGAVAARRGLLVLAAGIALFLALDHLAFRVANPWPDLVARLRFGGTVWGEAGVVEDQIAYRHMLARGAGEPRVFALGTSRARAAFLPDTLPPEADPARFGVVAHAGMMPFEMRSQLEDLTDAAPDAVVLFLSEFELFHPLQINPWLATGSFAATAELAREGGAAFVFERRETFLRLALVGLLDSYRFRMPLRRAGLDSVRTFATDLRVRDLRPVPVLYAPGSGPDFEAAKTRVTALIALHLEGTGALVAHFEMSQVHSLSRGEHARIQRALLRTLVAGVRESGAAVIVVELPLFPGAEALYDPTLREDFLAFAAELVVDEGVRFVSRDALPPVVHADFFDLTHLGPKAARRVTRRVASIVAETLGR